MIDRDDPDFKFNPKLFLRPVSYEDFLRNADHILSLYPELSSDVARRELYDALCFTYLRSVGA